MNGVYDSSRSSSAKEIQEMKNNNDVVLNR